MCRKIENNLNIIERGNLNLYIKLRVIASLIYNNNSNSSNNNDYENKNKNIYINCLLISIVCIYTV